MKDSLPARVCFGGFELNLKTGELLGNGQTVHLARKPFRVLLLLVEHAGELVTREEIQKKLWPNDTIVDFEHGINSAIKILRRALGDSAEQPKHIQTFPRRGYRLMTLVEWTGKFSGPAGSGEIIAYQVGILGKKVSHYRVLEVIGGGGMGLVYKAEDLKLGRRVALKFLPEELANDTVALQRFEREAQTASTLNHPNICTIYEIEEHEGQPFIVMELLEGETLRDRLAASSVESLPLGRLLDIAIQICDGLHAAHQKGVIHRDIKPANIFLTAPGQVKILDFGLAKLISATDKEHAAAAVQTAAVQTAAVQTEDRLAPMPKALDPTDEPPSARGPFLVRAKLQPAADFLLTHTGVALGTAGYMSPEQVRGEKLDARTDLFSFGLVLYEMATGQRAFSGETAAVVHDAILKNASVPVRELNSTLPAKLVNSIDRALQKDREQRYQSAAEMRSDLEKISSGKRRTSHRLWPAAALPALLIAVAVAGGLYQRSWRTLRLVETDTIVLADFSNLTTDPMFDDVLNAALRVELEQTPFLNPLSPDKVRGTLKQIHHSESEHLTPELARDVCLRTNSKAFVAGSVVDAGNHYGIELRAVNCQTGRELARAGNQAESRNQVVSRLGVAGDDLRRKLGEPEASIQKFHRPLEEALSPSLEALQAYSLGFNNFYSQGEEQALPHLERAVQLDPNFAAAYVKLGFAYTESDQPLLASRNGTRAHELRDRVTTKQRLFIEYFYNGFVTGDAEKTMQTLIEWGLTYPVRRPAADLAYYLRTLGRFPEAAVEAQEAVRADPSDGTAVGNFTLVNMGLNALDEVRNALEAAEKRGLDTSGIHRSWYWLAFLQNNVAAMQKELQWAERKAQMGDPFPFMTSHDDALTYYGHLGKARKELDQMIDKAKGSRRPEMAASFTTSGAIFEAMTGNYDRARKAATASLVLSQGPYVRAQAALSYAIAGESTKAEQLASQLSEEFPLDTMMQKYTVPMIRAAAVLHSRPANAIEILKVVEPYELGGKYQWNLEPIYVRGLAYLQAGEGQQAATEFQKIIDHPGIVLTCVHGALARLQLGRAQVMVGDKAAARKSYQDFLTLWKDADPDIPIYIQAKAEYAKLR